MIRQKEVKLRMNPGTFYVWVGGSCDYNSSNRESAGAYIIENSEGFVDTFVTADSGTTEFRMILTVMVRAMEFLPERSDIVFVTNVSYIQQNFDKMPTEKSANADLIGRCIEIKQKHNNVIVKIVPFHKYQQLPQTHEMAHGAMKKQRLKNDK